jgi:apolipoprotein D and lipocalin family protein
MKTIATFLAFALIVSCQSNPTASPPQTVSKVDVKRYAGKWHEIARLPMAFQKAEEAAIAEYGLNQDGTITVKNTAVRADGSTRTIRGSATVLNPGSGSKLLVKFSEWFSVFIPLPKEGNYWILHVDADYSHAVVGTPDRKFLWILARKPRISDTDRKRLEGIAKARGFDLSRLIRSAQHVPKEKL